jgi:sec-independent protein translocase protein TatA
MEIGARRHLMPTIGTTELIIILVIVILLFGIGRITKVAGELGKGIRSFKDGLKGEDKPDEEKQDKTENK